MKWLKWMKPFAAAASRSDAGNDRGSMRVPDGHDVRVHHAKGSLPGVVQAPGGVWLAMVGGSSDEQLPELEDLIAQVHALTGSVRPRIALAASGGPLSSLFAPANPEVLPLDGWLTWALDAVALAGALEAPLLLQRLLRSMYQIARHPMAQSVYLINHDTPAGLALQELIRELGVIVRRAEPDLAVLLEVRRPEGIVISSLLGQVIDGDAPGPGWITDINERQDRAANAPDRESILEEERQVLAARLAQACGPRRAVGVDRAPRLQRLLLAAVEGPASAALRQLHQELAGREHPLLYIADAKSGGGELREWPDGMRALPAFGDRTSLFAHARQRGLQEGSFSWAEMRASDLVQIAAEQGTTIALCASDAIGQPVHLPLRPDAVLSP